MINQKFYKELGYFPDIENPKTYNEKIQNYKLYYRNSLMTKYIDKYTFKSQIEKELGKGYTIPLIGVYDSVYQIDFDKLPKSFVIKSNQTGGGQYGIKVVKDKSQANIDEIKFMADNWLRRWNNVYWATFDWGYKDIEPKLIIEEYKEDSSNGELRDYKFLCFDGEPQYMWIDTDRFENHKRNIYDMNLKKTDCEWRYPNFEDSVEFLPKKFEEMKEIARQLSKPFPHTRVDMYEVDGKIYLGELTFYSETGFGRFFDRKWDYKMGELFNLE